jgi:hypothetical protein
MPRLLLCPQVSKRLHVQQQDNGGEDGYEEFEQDPIVPEQAPWGAQGLDKPGQQRGKAQWDEEN